MSEPLAYFLTWTTYGTWLPGDERPWVNRRNASPGMAYNPPCEGLRGSAKSRMAHEPVILSPGQRRIVEEALTGVCRHRQWELIAVNCRTNHVHAIVRTSGAKPESVMRQFKAYATRGLRDHDECPWSKVWTRHGSTRYINSRAALDSAVQYVNFQ